MQRLSSKTFHRVLFKRDLLNFNPIECRRLKNMLGKQFFSKNYRKPNTSWRPPDFHIESKKSIYYNIGVYCAVFGICYSIVPLYRIFCEHMGLDGDLNQKDYSMKDKKIHLHRKFMLRFKGDSDPEINWDFEPIQDEMIVNAGETALTFYRVYNKEDKPIVGFSTYSVYPEEASVFFSKIQCFCFHQQMVNPHEELMLPIYFYLEPEILEEPFLEKTDEITIVYRFFRSKMQDMAKFAEDELKRVERNKQILAEMRSKKDGAKKTKQEVPIEDVNRSITGNEEEVYQETRKANAEASR